MIEQSTAMLTLPVTDRDHALGPADAAVTLVEYGDFECSYCAAAFPVVELLRKQQGGKLRFVFRHFPLQQSHPHAEYAAEAAEAAGEKGRFWEMHATLFANQDALASSNLTAYAEQLGIDAFWFHQVMAARTFEQHVRTDFMSGVRSGVNGTPTFFVNGLRHDDEPSLVSLTDAVETARRERASRKK